MEYSVVCSGLCPESSRYAVTVTCAQATVAYSVLSYLYEDNTQDIDFAICLIPFQMLWNAPSKWTMTAKEQMPSSAGRVVNFRSRR